MTTTQPPGDEVQDVHQTEERIRVLRSEIHIMERSLADLERLDRAEKRERPAPLGGYLDGTPRGFESDETFFVAR